MPDPDPKIVAKSCAHCGLPVPAKLALSDPAFCCNGCRTVYGVLNKAGLDETFYRLRDASNSRTLAAPAKNDVRQQLLTELDSDVFLESHSSVLDGGIHRTHLYLDGVHCAACVWLVERLPGEMEGVRSANLNLPRARLTLEWDPNSIKLSAIARWLNQFGYPVQPRVDGEEAPESREERRLLIKMGVCWALAGNIMLIAFALYSGLDQSDGGLFSAARWASFLLAIPAVWVGGGVFFKKAYHSARASWNERSIRHLHMDTPISIGILVGFIASTIATVTGNGEVWFDSVAVLIAALLSARWLQLRARRLAGNSTEQLLALLPTLARKVGGFETSGKVRADDLVIGDVVEVKAGELIPVDGEVILGASLVNSSVLTGESKPVNIQAGSTVFAGTTNESGTIHVKVSASGVKTNVGRLLSWVADAKVDRPRILGLADRMGGWFTLTVLIAAGITAIIWGLVDSTQIAPHVIALLVITCPCALGMATPLALAVGTGKAARKGIFIKSESVIDWITRVDAVVLDKTGTLTKGETTINAIHGSEQDVLLARALEKDNLHPIAKAFRSYVGQESSFDIRDVRYETGFGIEGEIDGQSVRVGKPSWLAQPNEPLHAFHQNHISNGHTVVAIEINGATRTMVAIYDPIRDNAQYLLKEVSDAGKTVFICSGDHQATTNALGLTLGIPAAQCLGNQTPEMKRVFVESLMKEGKVVAMVGDGVNDAAALQAAHVGIAVSDGTAASQFAADAYTTRTGLEAVAELFRESKGVLNVIHRNLGFSLLYNVGGGLMAMLGFVTPLAAAVAMPVSSFIVVLSSILQRTFKITK